MCAKSFTVRILFLFFVNLLAAQPTEIPKQNCK